jgi:hypothetical protein
MEARPWNSGWRIGYVQEMGYSTRPFDPAEKWNLSLTG